MADPDAKTTAPGRDLNAAIASCFSPYIATPAFPDRLVELAGALTNARSVAVWMKDEEEGWVTIARSPGAKDADAQIAVLDEIAPDLPKDAASVRFAKGYLAARIALDGGAAAILLVAQTPGNAAVQGLSYERISLLAQLSFSQFHHPDVLGQRKLSEDVLAVAAGQYERLQGLADRIAQLSGADVAAAAIYDGTQITELSISGQDGMTKRAQLPKDLRADLSEVARLKTTSPDRIFAETSGPSQAGLVLSIEGARRATATLPLAAAIFAQASHSKPKSKWTAQRFVKLVAAALILFGIAMIPIPDGADLPAQVEASTRRIVTAPFSGIIAEVSVEENARVTRDQVMLSMDTREVELELIGVLAERATAVINREAARAARNASQLRNAELEVERLQARIDLLEARKKSGTLSTSINGIAVLGDLPDRVGATVRQGDPLLEIADPTALHLDITVLESHVARIAEGNSGTFRPDFDPSLSHAAEITFISPAIDLQQDPPRLTARATFEDPPDNLRPGLSGVLIIGDTYRPIWQVLYTNLRDWLLLRFFL